MSSRFLAALIFVGAAASLAAQSTVSFETYGVSQTTDYGAGRNPSIVAGDFERDGYPDLVQCCNSSEQLMFLAGNGDGTFQPPVVAWSTPVDAPRLVAADVRGDGMLDLIGIAAANPAPAPAASGYSLFVWMGNGDGTYQTPQTYGIGSPDNAGPLVVGNFFGDGRVDIAVGLGSGEIDLFRNEGNGSFAFDKSINLGGTDGSIQLVAGDLNGNGVSDLAAAVNVGTTSSGSTGSTIQISVLWNDGQGNFTEDNVGSYTYQDAQPQLSISRLNGTAQMDLLVSYQCLPSGGASYCVGFDGYYGQGDNTIYKGTLVTDSSNINPAELGQIFGVDVNGDGYGDIVAVGALRCEEASNISCTNNSPVGLFTWLGNANGSFQQTAQAFYSSTLINVGPAAMADFARNGMMDFAQPAISPSFLEVYLNSTPRTTCGTYTISHSVTVCQPVDNTYLPSPVRVQANSYDTTKVTAMQQYVDGSLVYSQPVTSFNTTFTEGWGSHLFVTKGWDASGRSFVADRTVTVYTGAPGPACSAATDSASICLPSAATSSSPVLILANGDTGTSITTAAQLYIDGTLAVNNKADCNSNGACYGVDTYVQASENLSSGTHDLVFKVWDQAGNVYQAQKTITVN